MTELATTGDKPLALQMSVPLESTIHLKNISGSDLAIIGDAFPGKLTEEEKTAKARTMVAQFAMYIDNIDNSKGGRDKVLRCVTQSVAECMMTLALLDLPLTKSLGYAALIPYGNVCTVTLMYQGLCDLIYRTGTVASIQCGLVFEGDTFAYELGTKPALRCIRGTGPGTEVNMTHAWAIAHNQTGPDTVEVMERSELDKVKSASKMKNGPAWKNWWGQMYRKAPIRRMAKYLQTSVGGDAQTILARGLELENSQYDLGKMEQYREIREENSKGLLAEASEAFVETMVLAGTVPPPTADEDNALLAKVAEMRDSVESSMSNEEFIQQVTFDLTGKQEISSKEGFNKVWNEIVNTKNRDLDTAEKFPEGM